MAATAIDQKTIEPAEPIDPTHCPTCLSGTPPRDPWYDEAIGVGGESR